MYDYEKLGSAMKKFNADFLPDALASSMLPGPAKAFDLLDMKLYRWPTHGVASTAPFQCVEAEYMRADEYDLLIADPTNFFLRNYFPRIFGNIAPWQKLPAMTDMTEWPLIAGALASLGNPEVQAPPSHISKPSRLPIIVGLVLLVLVIGVGLGAWLIVTSTVPGNIESTLTSPTANSTLGVR